MKSLAKQAATCGQTWEEVEQEAQKDEKDIPRSI